MAKHTERINPQRALNDLCHADAASIGRMLQNEATKSVGQPQLREHQVALLKALSDHIDRCELEPNPDPSNPDSKEELPIRDFWGIAPQAFGKTIVFTYLYKALFANAETANQRQGVWVEPDNRLIVQTLRRINEHAPELLPRIRVYCTDPSEIQSKIRELAPELVDRNIQIRNAKDPQDLPDLNGKILLTNCWLLPKLLDASNQRHPTITPTSNTIFAGDEIHTNLSEMRSNAITPFIKAHSLVVNLTATPAYSDGRNVSDILHRSRPPFYRIPVRDSIMAGLGCSAAQTLMLADVKLNLASVRQRAQHQYPDLTEDQYRVICAEERDKADREGRVRIMVEDWGHNTHPITGAPICGTKTMAFFPDKTMADRATELFNATYGEAMGRPPAVILHSDLSADAKRRVMQGFSDGRYRLYAGDRASIFEKYESLQTELEQHLDSTGQSWDTLFKTQGGINVLMAGNARGNLLHANTAEILHYVATNLKLKQGSKKPSAENFIPVNKVNEYLLSSGYPFDHKARAHFDANGAFKAKLRKDIKGAAVDTQEKGNILETGLGVRVMLHEVPSAYSNRVTQHMYVHKEDVEKYATKVLNLQKRVDLQNPLPKQNLALPPDGYISTDEAQKLMAALTQRLPMALPQAVIEGCLDWLKRDYITHQRTLKADGRNKTPFMGTGIAKDIHVVAGLGEKSSPTLFVNQKEFVAHMLFLLREEVAKIQNEYAYRVKKAGTPDQTSGINTVDVNRERYVEAHSIKDTAERLGLRLTREESRLSITNPSHLLREALNPRLPPNCERGTFIHTKINLTDDSRVLVEIDKGFDPKKAIPLRIIIQWGQYGNYHLDEHAYIERIAEMLGKTTEYAMGKAARPNDNYVTEDDIKKTITKFGLNPHTTAFATQIKEIFAEGLEISRKAIKVNGVEKNCATNDPKLPRYGFVESDTNFFEYTCPATSYAEASGRPSINVYAHLAITLDNIAKRTETAIEEIAEEQGITLPDQYVTQNYGTETIKVDSDLLWATRTSTGVNTKRKR